MSCCGGKCGCGGNCNGCAGCKAFPEKAVEGSTSAAMTASDMVCYEEMSVAGENGCKCAGGCKCGENCTCNPCNCK